MDLDRVSGLHVRYFLCVVDQGSVAAAARVLNISQPSLSQQISQLERRLGVTLFHRSGQGMRTTQEGDQLVDAARAWITSLRSISSARPAPAVVGVPRGSGPDILDWVRGRFEGDIEFQPCTTATAPAMVLDRRLDAAIIRDLPAAFANQVTSVTLPPQPLGLLTSVDTANQHGIDMRQPVRVESLTGCRLLWFDENRAPAHARKLRELLHRRGWEPDTYAYDPASDSLTLDALRNNPGLIALRPEPAELAHDMGWSPITPPLTEQLFLITRTNNPPP